MKTVAGVVGLLVFCVVCVSETRVNREFTLEFECQDAKRLPICDYVVTSVGLGMKGSCGDPLFDRMPVPAQNGHYDENGCFYFQGRCCFGEVSVVVGPVQCKRVGK